MRNTNSLPKTLDKCVKFPQNAGGLAGLNWHAFMSMRRSQTLYYDCDINFVARSRYRRYMHICQWEKISVGNKVPKAVAWDLTSYSLRFEVWCRRLLSPALRHGSPHTIIWSWGVTHGMCTRLDFEPVPNKRVLRARRQLPTILWTWAPTKNGKSNYRGPRLLGTRE